MEFKTGELARDRITLSTARLLLRRAKSGDAQRLYNNYTGDPACSRYLQRGAHTAVAQTAAMLHKWSDAAWETAGAPFSWVICDKETDEAIGVFLAIPEGHKTEFHYGIAKRYWGRGLTAEAGAVALEALWRTPSTQRIWTVCDVENIGSKRVLEKLGLHCEGVLKKWAVTPAFGPEARDCYVFGTTLRP
ncbi:GNAT family N-acetyltransferase [Paraburkholderia sp. BCC1876]|uniref:GNAT family N-acetyltransferase n=1 Tax=Paraburkholderia sp. BCC1876 TaxID=2676303 RepID=UPI0015928F44|nr:GNAT family N-acetyltransferase [Paraburkholderia sp. BCC1876]